MKIKEFKQLIKGFLKDENLLYQIDIINNIIEIEELPNIYLNKSNIRYRSNTLRCDVILNKFNFEQYVSDFYKNLKINNMLLRFCGIITNLKY